MSPGGGRRAAATKLARDFLAALERGDRTAAESMATADFVAEGPGGGRADLAGLMDRLEGRYMRLVKGVETTEVAETAEGHAVYFFGRMEGAFTNGEGSFDGVRFNDRITVREGKITGQIGWNDFGHKPAR